MKKYIALIKVGIQKELIYRTNFYIGIFSAVLLFIVEIAIWLAVYQDKAQIENMCDAARSIYLLLSIDDCNGRSKGNANCLGDGWPAAMDRDAGDRL